MGLCHPSRHLGFAILTLSILDADCKAVMTPKDKELFKVLVAVAWIDGDVSEEENVYLTGLAYKCDLNDDPEVQDLLKFEQPIPFKDCLDLIRSYLDGHRSEEMFNQMVKSIKSLIKSDGVVASEEQAFLQVSNFLHEVHENPQIVAQLKQCESLEAVSEIAAASGYAIEQKSLKSVAAQVEMEKKMQLVASAYLVEGEQLYEEDIQSANELIYDVLGLDLEFKVENVWAPTESTAPQLSAVNSTASVPGTASANPNSPPSKKKKFWSFWQRR